MIVLVCRTFRREAKPTGFSSPEFITGVPELIPLEEVEQWGVIRFSGRHGNFILARVRGRLEPLVVVQEDNRSRKDVVAVLRKIRSQLPKLGYIKPGKDNLYWQIRLKFQIE